MPTAVAGPIALALTWIAVKPYGRAYRETSAASDDPQHLADLLSVSVVVIRNGIACG